MLVGDSLAQNVRLQPDRTALVFGDLRYTWRELNDGANRFANAMLKRGVKAGDRVVYPLENGVEFVQIFFGLSKIGAIGAPVMPNQVGSEIAHVIDDLGAKYVIVGQTAKQTVNDIAGARKTLDGVIGIGEHSFALDFEKLTHDASSEEPDIMRDPDADLTIKYTSGTTGTPKGCIKTHRQILACGMINLFHTPFIDGDAACIAGPMAAGANLSMLSLYVLGGAKIVMLPKFDATWLLEAIEREKLSIVHASQSTFTRFTGHPDLLKYDLSSVRYYSGSSPVGGNTTGMSNLRANPTFKGQFFCAYASSEAGGRITYLLPNDIDGAFAPGGRREIVESVGRAARLCRIEAMDEDMKPVPAGEIGLMAVKAPQVFKGYWNRPEETKEVFRDGWFMTGDLLKKDVDGFIYLSGRSRDVVRTGGMNVYPAEIEPVFRSHPKVKEVAVVGVPHPDWGEMVVACVVPQPGQTVGEAELIDYARDRLAPYKRPKQVKLLDALPENQIGKVLKKDLRDMLVAESKKS
jgi:acyl-CoA synthetase (AMP-forming)/AMP-acid ligase II